MSSQMGNQGDVDRTCSEIESAIEEEFGNQTIRPMTLREMHEQVAGSQQPFQSRPSSGQVRLVRNLNRCIAWIDSGELSSSVVSRSALAQAVSAFLTEVVTLRRSGGSFSEPRGGPAAEITSTTPRSTKSPGQLATEGVERRQHKTIQGRGGKRNG